MYGLLLLNIEEFILKNYGKIKWDEIRINANLEDSSFTIYQVYPDSYITRIAESATKILNLNENDLFEKMGTNFVTYLKHYGYDQVLSLLGRHFRDFISLDNLHANLKFTYPKLTAPSFMCENETKAGLTLHYKSKRTRLVHYMIGILKEVAKIFYDKDLKVELIKKEMVDDLIHVSLLLKFDNEEVSFSTQPIRKEQHLPICSSIFFEIFPFSIVFSNDMKIRHVGNSLMPLIPDFLGRGLTEAFEIVRPILPPQFEKILLRANNTFELVTKMPVLSHRMKNALELSESKGQHFLTLRGQMMYMKKWEMIMFLGTPVASNLDCIIEMGLYINDLSMHDFSRDIMLAGTQQSVQLKLALEQEQEKTHKIEESMTKLDEEMERTNKLLYQMIPESVAERLRSGVSPIETCQKFNSVSILFSDVVQFTEICSHLSPMEVVSMLNGMYSIFDNLTELHEVHKVETIGDAYMVFSGTMEEENNHVSRICNMALDMVKYIQTLKDPNKGIHTGPVVAGIVGLKMPRYCLFGKTVTIASQMEAKGQPMKIQITKSTNDLLPSGLITCYREEIKLKDGYNVKTYWLQSKNLSEEKLEDETRQIDNACLNQLQYENKLDVNEMVDSKEAGCCALINSKKKTKSNKCILF